MQPTVSYTYKSVTFSQKLNKATKYVKVSESAINVSRGSNW